jgi:hypothetical protein
VWVDQVGEDFLKKNYYSINIISGITHQPFFDYFFV